MLKKYRKSKTISKIALIFFLLTYALFLSSCSPKISIQKKKGDAVSASFSTGFSNNSSKMLRAIAGIDETEMLFNTADIERALESFAITDVKTILPSPNEIKTSGTVQKLTENELSKAKIITSGSNFLELSLGPDQFKSVYALLDEMSQAYFDMLMIPSLMDFGSDEKMSVNEYKDMLATLYGPAFAEELVNGKLSISLCSPDGKKKLDDSVSLGEILTLNKTKTWKLSW